MTKVFRCGWCGNPTDSEGNCITEEVANAIAEADWENAEAVQGKCCPNGDGQAVADARRDAWEREMRADAFGERC